MEDIKNLIRMADRIQEALIKLKNGRYLELMRQLTSFAGQLQELTTQSRKMGTSLVHGWFSAAGRCCNGINRLLSDIQYSLPRIRPLVEKPQVKIPKLSALVGELDVLEQEFGNIEYDISENTISVVTDSITLEDVYLGPFKIQLELNKLSELYQNSVYHVIALEPNPAATDDNVTHPHVSNETLCEGDGCVAIRSAIEEGRVCDFFTMVRSILNTYNPDSPYVALHDWYGEPCYECGYVMGSDSSYYCCFCERDFCEECATYCRSCDETVCAGCTERCEVCDEPMCPRCARIRCTECECVCCESCIEEGLCPDCKQERKNEDEEKQITGTKETGTQSEPQNNTEIKLAS